MYSRRVTSALLEESCKIDKSKLTTMTGSLLSNNESNSKFYSASKIDTDPIRSKLLEMLQHAYADEWVAVYQYSVEADYMNMMNYHGKLSDKAYFDINKELIQHSSEEFNHSKLLIPEIIRLGGSPVNHINNIESSSNGKFLVPVECQKTVLTQAIQSESGAIKVYSDISSYIKDHPGSCSSQFGDVIKFILDQEYEHKSDLEKLLKEFKNV